jgi:hypothetical protein
VDLSHERTVLKLAEGEPLTVSFRGQDIELVPGEPSIIRTSADAHGEDALTGELRLDEIEEESILLMREGDAADESEVTGRE